MAVAIKKCQNTDCKVVVTDGVVSGKCVEGLVIEQCPHFQRETPQVSTPAEISESLESSSTQRATDISLPLAERLPIKEVSAFQKKGNTQVLAILGPSDSGKTSFIAALYTLFLHGPVNNTCFAGSDTLLAFEQACHDIRAISGQHEPLMKHTEHTTLPMGISFYHLAVSKGENSSVIHLLLGDRTGEDYTSSPDDPSITEQFVEVQTADHLLVLVNGEGLLKPASRENTKAMVSHMLKVLVDSATTRPSQKLLIALTKLDAIKEAGEETSTKVEQVFERLVSDIQRAHGSSFAEIQSIKIAASPKSKVLDFGFGVDKILESWLAEPTKSTKENYRKTFSSDRVIGKFLARKPET